MVFENFTDYGIFDTVSNMPPEEIAYQRMLESTNILERTDSGELYYTAVYSPRVPYKMFKTYDNYKDHNSMITHHKMLNDKKEMKENGVLFFLREIFCCR
jgi:hypothetical protein